MLRWSRWLKNTTLGAALALAAHLGVPSGVRGAETRPAWKFVEPAPPPFEDPCDPKGVLKGYVDPVHFLVEPNGEGRLIGELRAAARGKSETSLVLSAATFALARVPQATVKVPFTPPLPGQPLTPHQILAGAVNRVSHKVHGKLTGPAPKKPTDKDIAGWRKKLAVAFADLAVSGRRAQREFVKSPPTEATLVKLAKPLLGGAKGVKPGDIEQGAKQALARAKEVAAYFALVIPDPAKRKGLGWIAVSAEDDQPRRPVNIPSLGFPQYNIKVPVRTANGTVVDVNTRFAVINSKPQASKEPTIPKGDVVLLFIHGDSSRLEEVGHLIKPLLAAGKRHGCSYTIIAMDLPSHGYTSMVDPHGAHFKGTPDWRNHAPSPPGRPPSYPVLEFIEKFVVNFVGELDKKTGVAKQLLGPMGGSLGGNLSLRLARRSEPWIRQSVAWSPASVWNSLADDLIKQAGPNHCSTWGHRPETPETRREFFHDQLDATRDLGPINLLRAQGEYWYRDGWPCKKVMLQAARKDRQEYYSRIFRQWHFRMDREQLLYSFNDPDKGSKDPRWKSFRTRLLLGAGSEDNHTGAHIYDASRQLAANIAKTKARGRTFFLQKTGHSMHDERPAVMAAQIDAFSAETRGGGREWVNKSGSPLVRFTGDKHKWTTGLSVAGADAGRAVLQLTLTITSGGGALLPAGAADVVLDLKSGKAIALPGAKKPQPFVGGGPTQTVQLFLPAGQTVKAGDLKSFTLRTPSGGLGNTWNIDKVLLTAVVAPEK